MRIPKLIEKPDGGVIINENDDDLFVPSTPEELRQAEERLEAFGRACDEQRAEWLRNQQKDQKKEE